MVMVRKVVFGAWALVITGALVTSAPGAPPTRGGPGHEDVGNSSPASAKADASAAVPASARTRIHELERALADARARIRALESGPEKAKVNAAELTQARAHIQELEARLEKTIEGNLAKGQASAAELDLARDRIKILESSLAEARTRASQQETDLERVRAHIRELESGWNKANEANLAKSNASATELAQAGARLKDLERNLANERTRAGQSEVALAAARVRIQELDAALRKATQPNGGIATSRDQHNGDGEQPGNPGSRSRVEARDWPNDNHLRDLRPVGGVSLTNPGTQYSYVGDVVKLPLKAFDWNGNALWFSATGLPPGLSIEALTGTITGTINCADGWYSVTVSATDTGLHTGASQSFSWSVHHRGGNGGGALPHVSPSVPWWLAGIPIGIAGLVAGVGVARVLSTRPSRATNGQAIQEAPVSLTTLSSKDNGRRADGGRVKDGGGVSGSSAGGDPPNGGSDKTCFDGGKAIGPEEMGAIGGCVIGGAIGSAETWETGDPSAVSEGCEQGEQIGDLAGQVIEAAADAAGVDLEEDIGTVCLTDYSEPDLNTDGNPGPDGPGQSSGSGTGDGSGDGGGSGGGGGYCSEDGSYSSEDDHHEQEAE
jgi:hypothetical protein